jgi:hypothetical protein
MPLPQFPAVALAPVTRVSSETPDTYSIDLTAILPPTDLLDPAQTPVIVQSVGPDSLLTWGTPAVNTSTFANVQGATCAINCGVLVDLSGGTGLLPPQANYYLLRITCLRVSGKKVALLLPVYVQG